jgi:Putative transposase/Transposase zinc-binding domain
MALVTLQTLFQDAFPAYEQRHALPAYVRRAAHALMQCRTAALGGHIQACPDGHVSRVWYNSCRHRSCPQCAYLQTERWLALRRARLLACDHYHVIFTLPHDLNPLWLANVPVMTTLLFQTVRDTLGTLLADPQYLGAQPGILAALHTWSQTLVLHPHLHCLVTGGGLTPDGHWKAVRNGFLLPARVVMAVFRGKMLGALRRAFARDVLVLPEAMRPQQFLNLLNRLGHAQKTPWNVHIRERYRHGAGVVTYLARYLRGGPIKNARLVAWDGDRVTFTYRARQEEAEAGPASSQRMTLPVAAFLQRWLLHVPVPQTRVVRCYGLYHQTHTEALSVCRTALGQAPVEVPVSLDWQTLCAQRGEAHPERCPTCGQRLVCTSVIPRGGAPPPVLAGERAA